MAGHPQYQVIGPRVVGHYVRRRIDQTAHAPGQTPEVIGLR